MNRWKKRLIGPGLMFFALFLGACGELGYYAQGVAGHLDLMRRCRPIEEVIVEPGTPPELAEKLQEVLRIRDYASRALYLPENGSYRKYADLERPYVVWNLVATKELSIEPVTWCFPVAGCVSYRGYFSEERARKEQEKFQAEGYDLYLYGVSAYSTLRWFEDPMLNTMLRRTTAQMAALIFHELSHQVVYVPGDSAFNEAFAKTVELEGARRYLEAQGRKDEFRDLQETMEREQDFINLVLKTRGRLQEIYSSKLSDEQKRQGKAEAFSQLKADYAQLREGWGGYSGYDRWFEGELNNARLVSVSTYHRLVPAFENLMVREEGDFRRFFARVKEYASLQPNERTGRLDALLNERPVRLAKQAEIDAP